MAMSGNLELRLKRSLMSRASATPRRSWASPRPRPRLIVCIASAVRGERTRMTAAAHARFPSSASAICYVRLTSTPAVPFAQTVDIHLRLRRMGEFGPERALKVDPYERAVNARKRSLAEGLGFERVSEASIPFRSPYGGNVAKNSPASATANMAVRGVNNGRTANSAHSDVSWRRQRGPERAAHCRPIDSARSPLPDNRGQIAGQALIQAFSTI